MNVKVEINGLDTSKLPKLSQKANGNVEKYKKWKS